MINKTRILQAGLLAILLIISMMVLVRGDPVGGELASNSTSQRTIEPGSRVDEGGTITTMLVTAVQQNYAWKAYVGNISGSLVLDDANNKSIYEWGLSSFTGEIIASRAGSGITWSDMDCATDEMMDAENTAVSMGSGDIDNINSTFNETAHTAITLAGNSLATCPYTATYINDTAQTVDATAEFQEILANGSSADLVYVANLEVDTPGYDNTGQKFDFQMIVADDDTAATITTYYFYVELDS